jgi:general stress protein CsbA
LNSNSFTSRNIRNQFFPVILKLTFSNQTYSQIVISFISSRFAASCSTRFLLNSPYILVCNFSLLIAEFFAYS